MGLDLSGAPIHLLSHFDVVLPTSPVIPIQVLIEIISNASL